MEIKIVSPEDVEFKEKDIQRAFERDLGKLEEGLEFVDTEVTLGVGRIDTLAFDTNTYQPVFIEYKGEGEFSKEALIQLMDYLSWFARDESRLAILEKIVRQKKPDIEGFEPDIRLICVVTDIDERIRNAIYAIANHIVVYSYFVTRDTAGNVIVVPKLEVDNSEVETAPGVAVDEHEMLKKHPHLEPLYRSLKAELEKDGVESYTRARSVRFRKRRVIAKLTFRENHILLELRVGVGQISDSEFKYWRKGASDWGWTKVTPSKGITEKIIRWIVIARIFDSLKESQSEEGKDE